MKKTHFQINASLQNSEPNIFFDQTHVSVQQEREREKKMNEMLIPLHALQHECSNCSH